MLRRHHFHSVDPAKNRQRFYRLTECATLFGECCLLLEWGRVGTNARKAKSEIFSDAFARAVRFDAIARLRQQHGYSLVA